jgi:hypothetical protein
MEQLELKISDSKEKLRKLLLSLFSAAISKQIKTTGKPYVIGPGWENRTTSEVIPSIHKEFGIKLRLVDAPENNYIVAHYVFTDKVFEIFKRFSVPAYIEVSFENETGELPVVIAENQDLKKIKSCDIPFLFVQTKEEFDKLDGLLIALEKYFLFTIIKS